MVSGYEQLQSTRWSRSTECAVLLSTCITDASDLWQLCYHIHAVGLAHLPGRWLSVMTACQRYVLSTLCLKKVPTFTLSVTLSNLNRFPIFLHRWKAYESSYKTCTTLPTSPLACCYTTLGNKKTRIFCRYLAHVEENANKFHFKSTNFNSSTRVTVYSGCIYVFLSKSCSRHWIPCWLLTNTAVTNFQCHKVIAKVNK